MPWGKAHYIHAKYILFNLKYLLKNLDFRKKCCKFAVRKET